MMPTPNSIAETAMCLMMSGGGGGKKPDFNFWDLMMSCIVEEYTDIQLIGNYHGHFVMCKDEDNKYGLTMQYNFIGTDYFSKYFYLYFVVFKGNNPIFAIHKTGNQSSNRYEFGDGSGYYSNFRFYGGIKPDVIHRDGHFGIDAYVPIGMDFTPNEGEKTEISTTDSVGFEFSKSVSITPTGFGSSSVLPYITPLTYEDFMAEYEEFWETIEGTNKDN